VLNKTQDQPHSSGAFHSHSVEKRPDESKKTKFEHFRPFPST